MSVVVELLSRSRAEVVTDDGEVLPITRWLDGDNEECEPTDAIWCVAGREDWGWVALRVADYEPLHVS
jgi:hypothetical protein